MSYYFVTGLPEAGCAMSFDIHHQHLADIVFEVVAQGRLDALPPRLLGGQLCLGQIRAALRAEVPNLAGD